MKRENFDRIIDGLLMACQQIAEERFSSADGILYLTQKQRETLIKHSEYLARVARESVACPLGATDLDSSTEEPSSLEGMDAELEYSILRGKNLLKQLTEDGRTPIEKEVIATLSTEDIEAMIMASVEDDVDQETIENLLEIDILRKPDRGGVLPPVRCFHYRECIGITLCDKGGRYSLIDEGECDGCPNYCIASWDLERYHREHQ